MARWHHQRNGHEFEHNLAVGCGQGILACCIPLGHKELDMIERVNRNDGDIKKISFAGGRQEEQMEYKDLGGSEITLYYAATVDTCHYSFLQTHRLYNTKNEPWYIPHHE